MNGKATFSLGRALSAALGFLPRALAGAWLVLLLLWLVPMAAMHLSLMGGHGAMRPVMAGIGLISLVVKLMALGALYRLALFGGEAKGEGLGLGGFQFGKPEWRLLGAGIIVGLFVLLIAATLFIVFAVILNLSGQTAGYDTTLAAVHASFMRHSAPIDFILIGYVVAAFVFLIFVGLKFSLMNAATVAEHRMVTLNALGLSSGNVGKLFLGLLAIALPFVVVAVGLLAVLWHQMAMRRIAAFVDPGSMADWHMRFMVHGVLQLVTVLVILPLTVGFLASAYRQITDSRPR